MGDENYESFEDGLSFSLRSIVREARRFLFTRQEERMRPVNEQRQRDEVDEEWSGVLTLPDLRSTTFDFNVLRNLLESNKEHSSTSTSSFTNSSSAGHVTKLQKLQARQRGDKWRYDIGLPDLVPEEEQSMREEEEQEESIDDIE